MSKQDEPGKGKPTPESRRRNVAWRSPEEKRKILADMKRFPTDDEWDEMTPIERASFIMDFD
jgi:hypothetical protein